MEIKRERSTGMPTKKRKSAVRALIQVWSDERICRKLESSTRKRDIFVQISRRLLQQGIDRDWKQCHTKYRNLKYLYRSLQRGKTDEADPRCLMRFYEEVDSIMNRVTNDYTEEDSDRLTISDNCDEKNNLNPLGPVAADRLHTQCKEEQDHIPILKINSVCSVPPPAPSPQVTYTDLT
uniref:Myb/SANT-like DNA-binding domain-containing protein n=1 Tax=Pundamilia nyererei TaxID=303518 RepID=A0A3B4H0N1_9CICH